MFVMNMFLPEHDTECLAQQAFLPNSAILIHNPDSQYKEFWQTFNSIQVN